MGLLRTWLALLVVIAHANADPLVSGIGFSSGALMAVQSYFILSGFYMALTWTEKYEGTPMAFYANRALRLLPTYWAILMLTVLASIALYLRAGGPADPLAQAWSQVLNSGLSWLAIPATVSNLFLFGLEAMTFVCLDQEALRVSLFFLPSSCPSTAGSLTVVGPAWSLGLEVLFYALCPLLLPLRTGVLIAVMAASVALRATLIATDFSLYNWTEQFFPTEICFFLAGVIAYRFYAWLPMHRVSRPFLWFALAVAIANSAIYARLMHHIYSTHKFVLDSMVDGPYYLLLALLVPFIFEATRTSKLDRLIGELSYPIYISHFLVLTLGIRIADKLGLTTLPGRFAFHLINVILVAVLCYVVIGRPVDRWRARVTAELRVRRAAEAQV